MQKINQFFVGEVGTCVQKAKIYSSSSECIMIATSMGSICCFMPFETREEIDLFVHLQMYMQLETQPLSGRDHAAFRSAMDPLKDVVDGDLCEEFSSLALVKQKAIADELDRSIPALMKRVDQLRQKVF